MLLAAVGSTGYEITLALHVLSVILGFGSVGLIGIYAKAAMDDPGPAGAAVAAAANRVARVAEIPMILVPLLGIGLVLMSDDVWGFGDPWVSASFLLYFIGIGIGFAVLRPAFGKFVEAVGDPAQVDEARRLYKLQAMAGGIANLSWVVVVFLMILKPGA